MLAINPIKNNVIDLLKYPLHENIISLQLTKKKRKIYFTARMCLFVDNAKFISIKIKETLVINPLL